MPKYAALLYGEESDPASVSPDEQQQMMSDYMEFGRVNGDSLAGGEALNYTSTATTLHVEGGKGGKAVFTDGPFAETKEALGGFYLIEADNLDDALKIAQQIPAAWQGHVEVRPVIEFDDEGQPIG